MNQAPAPLSTLSVISCQGPEAHKFLQGQLTADIPNVAGIGCLSAYCSLKGRVIALFEVFCLTEELFYLILPSDLAETVYKKLKRFVLFSKLTLKQEAALSCALASIEAAPSLQTDYQSLVTDEGVFCRYPGDNRPLLLITSDAISSTAADSSQADALWIQFYLEQGIARITAAQSEEFLPHPLNLPELKAVSFSKGCYVGQEIIARTEYRGKVRKHVRLFSIPAPISNEFISTYTAEGKAVGKVVCYQQTVDTSKFLILCICSDDEDFSTLFLDSEKQARLTYHPF